MFSRKFKNHNFTVRRDLMEEGLTVETLDQLVELVHNDIDAPEVAYIAGGDSVEFVHVGNMYASEFVAFEFEGARYWYKVDSDMVEEFNAGKTVRFVTDKTDKAPYFILPSYSSSASAMYEGEAGVIFEYAYNHRNNYPTGDVLETMLALGCKQVEVRAQYAPELRRRAIFVPYGKGITFDYE